MGKKDMSHPGLRNAALGKRPSFALLLMLALIFAVPAIAGCGKKGPPRPHYSTQEFSWRNVFAEVTETGCLSVNGSVSGSARNVEKIILEFQPLDESCVGCPFVPQERYVVDAAEAWEAPDADTFRFAYCPSDQAGAYRWRLVGHNSNRGLGDVFTPVKVTSGIFEPRTEQ